MELRTLHYFLAICQAKNITKAAASLHLAQPSLSRQMKELEHELGVTLFHRGHREIVLTEAGYLLQARAQEMIALEEKTLSALQQSQVLAGTLNIGAGQSPAMEIIMQVIDQIAQAHPQVRFNLIDGNADQIEAQVNNGSLDFGVIMGERPLSNFASLTLPVQNEFVAVFSDQLPLAEKTVVTPADLIAYPIITSNQTLVSDKFRAWWGPALPHLHQLMGANLAYNASLLAKQGHAVQLTYRHLLNLADQHLIARPLSPTVTDTNTVIWQANGRLTNLGRHFLQSLQTVVAAQGPDQARVNAKEN